MAPSRSTASRYAVSGRLTADRRRLEHAAPDVGCRRRGSTRVEHADLRRRGLVAFEAPRPRGELVFTGADARSAIGRLGEALGRHIVPMPSWLAAPFRLAGPVELADDRLQVPDFVVELDGSELTGRLSLVFAAWPEIDLALKRRDLRFLPSRLPSSVTAGSPRSAACFERARPARAVDRRARLPGRGDPPAAGGAAAAWRRHRQIEAARAILPGQTDVSFTGELAGMARRTGAARQAHGRDREPARGARLARPLARRCGRRKAELFSLASQVSIGRMPGALAKSSCASMPRGRPARWWSSGAAPTGRGEARARSLDVDAYWPDQAPADVLARLAPPLSAFDAAIEAQLARLDVGRRPASRSRLRRAGGGRPLTIKSSLVGDLAKARLQVAGEVGWRTAISSCRQSCATFTRRGCCVASGRAVAAAGPPRAAQGGRPRGGLAWGSAGRARDRRRIGRGDARRRRRRERARAALLG